MTVTPIRVVTMSNPSVTTLDSPPQMKTVSSRLSNFSVASLLADNRSVKVALSPVQDRRNNIVINSSSNHISARLSPNNNNNNNNDRFCPSPKNYSLSHANSCSPTVQTNENNDSSNSIRHSADNTDILERRSQTQTPHSSIASEEYDDSIHDDDDDDEDVDIEDVNSENSTNEKRPSLSSSSMPHPSLIGGSVPLRPTPFSALAAAAAAWGGMSANGVPGWASRQMPPFGPHGLPGFPGQFSGQMNGGKNSC